MTTTPAELIARIFAQNVNTLLAGAGLRARLHETSDAAKYHADRVLKALPLVVAALETAQAGPATASASDGYWLCVPVTPTDDMIIMGDHTALEVLNEHTFALKTPTLAQRVYSAMLSVAPECPECVAQPTQGSGDYVLAPKTASEAMITAAINDGDNANVNLTTEEYLAVVYRAMISAATPADGRKDA